MGSIRSFANGGSDPNKRSGMSEDDKILAESQTTFWDFV
jgi:hypothetical protein